jgi:hypothetical protein
VPDRCDSVQRIILRLDLAMTQQTASWTSGYVSELDYTHGYYREMAPLHLELAMLSKLQAHGVKRPPRYLELGFGQGLSLNIHAAASGGEFWGTDFNPAQAANARELAAASGADVKVLDASFAELAARDDLPEFDIIALHGIWSWISDENRQVIADIARRKLAVGGIMYVSYNTTPGWSAAIPLRHLMRLHLELASSEAQGLSSRIDQSLDFAESVVNSNAAYFRANPNVAEKLKGLKGQNRNYLAHEFFNADWHPMPFSKAAEYLESAKLSFGASANLSSHIDALHLPLQQQKLLASIAHPVLRESVRDYCENQQFRRDIFVKGPRTILLQRQHDLLRDQRFVLTALPDGISFVLKGQIGEVTLQESVYRPLITALAERGHAPKSVADLAAHPTLASVGIANVIQGLFVLAGLGHVSPAQDEARVAAQAATTRALNAHIMEKAVHSGDLNFLASPVTGGGMPVGRLQQLFLRAFHSGKKMPQEWAQDVWPILESQGQRLIKDGKTLTTAVENISELTTNAQEFAANRMLLLKALGVAVDPAGATGQDGLHIGVGRGTRAA